MLYSRNKNDASHLAWSKQRRGKRARGQMWKASFFSWDGKPLESFESRGVTWYDFCFKMTTTQRIECNSALTQGGWWLVRG